MNKQLNTPVLLVIFNRPETSDVAFEAIRKVRPNKLYIAADGPRENKPGELERCLEARKIVDRIDWPCELKTLFRKENLGCKAGTTGGIKWMLENEEYGIIFDDDCIANESFFYFCEELLEKYKNEDRVMHICGTNFHQKNPSFNIIESYYFSKISQNWGWATWKRAWDKYEPELESWPKYKGTEKFKNWIKNPLAQDYWSYVFDRRYDQEITDWDIPWTYSCMKNEGLCIVPKYNLVTNIGSGSAGTHGEKSDRMAHMPTTEIESTLIHPSIYRANNDTNTNKYADTYTYQYIYSIKMNMWRRILLFLKTHFPTLYKNVKLLMK